MASQKLINSSTTNKLLPTPPPPWFTLSLSCKHKQRQAHTVLHTHSHTHTHIFFTSVCTSLGASSLLSQSLVLSRRTGTFPPFTPLNCSGLLWKLLLMSKTIQKPEEQCVAEVLDSTPLINRSCDSQGQKLLICIFVIYIYIRKSLFPKVECTIVANTGYCKQFGMK